METADVERLFGLGPVEPKRPREAVKLYLDSDVLEWLRSHPSGTVSYVTRSILRQYMEACKAAAIPRAMPVPAYPDDAAG